MSNETIEIRKSNVIASYEEAQKAGEHRYMRLLENLFGKELFIPVTERIKTFEDACKELRIEADKVDLGFEPDVVAYMKLRIICAALNEGWKPEFTEDEVRWYPWFWLYTQDEINNMPEDEKIERHLISTGDYKTEYAGFAYANSPYAPSDTSTNIGSPLCLKSEALAVYCGKQFINLWADFNLIRRR